MKNLSWPTVTFLGVLICGVCVIAIFAPQQHVDAAIAALGVLAAGVVGGVLPALKKKGGDS